MTPCEIPNGTILCLGNFDGVHLGHRSLFRAAQDFKRSTLSPLPCGVFCFHGLSSDLLSSDPPKHIDSEAERLRKFGDCGMEFVILVDFARICKLSPKEFISSVLLDVCHAKAVVCGENYRFGKGGKGSPELLLQNGNLLATVLPELLVDGLPVSSTRIRRLIEENGDVKTAARLLGEPYALTAIVEHGKGLGHKLGIPTLNQSFAENALIPRHGVYFTETIIDGVVYSGVSNVGLRPSVERALDVNCETNLLSYSGSLYGKTVTTRFIERVRSEKTFNSQDTLVEAILSDLKQAKEFFANR